MIVSIVFVMVLTIMAFMMRMVFISIVFVMVLLTILAFMMRMVFMLAIMKLPGGHLA